MNIPPEQAFAITPEQVRFFEAFGYLKLPGIFRADIDEVRQRFDEQFVKRQADIVHLDHHAHYHRTRQILFHFIDSDPWFSALLGDSRIQAIATALGSEDFNFISSDGNIFSGNTVWHADNYLLPRGQTFFKIALYLDPMPTDKGAFRVIPGSHHEGAAFSKLMHQVLPDHRSSLGLEADQIPCQIIDSQPGDVIVFNYRLQHATCHAETPRRMFHFGVSPCFKTERNKDFLAMMRIGAEQQSFLYGDALLQQTDPRIHRRLQQFLALERQFRAESGQG